MQQEFIKFAIVGGLSVTINFVVYSVIFVITSLILPSAILGYSAGLFNSYALNKLWVFKSKSAPHRGEVFRFLLVYAAGGLGMLTLIYASYAALRIDYKFSWLIGAVYAVVNNYYGSKFLVFNVRRGK